MSILLLLTFIIIGGILYLFWPLIKLFLAFRNSSRSARSAFEQAQRQSGARGRGQKQPKRPHKIIDPSVGEYVEFEEIRTFTKTDTTTTEETSSRFSYRSEEQIEDAEWEDIK